MKFLILLLTVVTVNFAHAEDKIKMHYNNEELTKVIETYSKATGQKFVVDPAVRGRISILLQETVSKEEAFNQLSIALAVNGFAISKQGDTMVVKSARNVQRDLIEVSTERPSLKPERMYTWVYTVKNLPAGNILRDLRMLVSKDGEVSLNFSTNQLIFTDWASSLNRVADLMKEVDKPLDPGTAKIIDSIKKDKEKNRKEDPKKEKAAS